MTARVDGTGNWDIITGGQTLTKSSGASEWVTHYADSSQSIASGECYVEMTVVDVSKYWSITLTRLGNMDYTWMSNASGYAEVRETNSDTYRHDVAISNGDRLRISSDGLEVTYQLNGGRYVFWTDNLNGHRLDLFMAKIPYELLYV